MRTQPAPTPAPQRDADAQPADERTPGRGTGWLRIALPVLAVAVVAAVRPAIVTGTLGSPRALAIVAGVVAATVGWSALLRRHVRGEGLRTALVLLPVGLFLAVYVAPYFGGDQVVDEALPPAAGAADPIADPAAEPAADGQVPVADAGATGTPAGGTSGQDAATATDADPDADAATAGAAPGGDGAAEPVAPPPPAGPVELSRGTFVGLDDHFATGAAALYDLGDGERIVRLEDVDLQRVPDAHVYLVPGADATEPTEGASYLGPLTGNVGSSNYALPADLVLDGPFTVLVWCEAFASPVGAATQA